MTKAPESPSLKPDSAPINATPLRRFMVRAAIRLLRPFRPRYNRVLMLSDRICVKYGSFVHLSEASTMRFIAEHTSIPVPKVYCAFTHGDWTYIVMERIKGDMLGQAWMHRSAESKAKLLAQLKRMIQEIRTLSPPPGLGVANVDGGPLSDDRLHSPDGALRFGPFRDVQEFHRHLRAGTEHHPNHDPEITEFINAQANGQWPLVFTHGDLSSLNILARGDQIVGIVDWETAGWFPAYWEYTTACQVNPHNPFWREEIEKFLDPWPDELRMEAVRQRWWNAI